MIDEEVIRDRIVGYFVLIVSGMSGDGIGGIADFDTYNMIHHHVLLAESSGKNDVQISSLSNGCKFQASSDSGNRPVQGKGVYCEVESEGSLRQKSGLTNKNYIHGICLWHICPKKLESPKFQFDNARKSLIINSVFM